MLCHTTFLQLQNLFQLSLPNNPKIGNVTSKSQEIIAQILTHKILIASYLNIKRAKQPHLLGTEKALENKVLHCLAEQLKIKKVRHELLKHLNNKKVKFTELKGFELSSLLYPNEDYRQIRDIDILVKAEDLQTVHELLISMGALLVKPRSIQMYLSYERRYKDIVYRFPNTNVLIELHTRLVSVKTLANRTLSAALLEGKTSIHEDFVYLCIHGISSGFHRLKWLTDIYLMTHQQDFCWQKAYRYAQKINAVRHLFTAYILLNLLSNSRVEAFKSYQKTFNFQVARFIARICILSLSKSQNMNKNKVYLCGKVCELLCVESMFDLRMFIDYVLSPRLKQV